MRFIIPFFPALPCGQLRGVMQAWFFATALAKQYSATIKLLEEGMLDNWVHNKAIQKAIESHRIDSDTKKYLRTLINIHPHSGWYFIFGHSPNTTGGAQVRF